MNELNVLSQNLTPHLRFIITVLSSGVSCELSPESLKTIRVGIDAGIIEWDSNSRHTIHFANSRDGLSLTEAGKELANKIGIYSWEYDYFLCT